MRIPGNRRTLRWQRPPRHIRCRAQKYQQMDTLAGHRFEARQHSDARSFGSPCQTFGCPNAPVVRDRDQLDMPLTASTDGCSIVALLIWELCVWRRPTVVVVRIHLQGNPVPARSCRRRQSIRNGTRPRRAGDSRSSHRAKPTAAPTDQSPACLARRAGGVADWAGYASAVEWTPARIRLLRDAGLCESQHDFATTLGGCHSGRSETPSVALTRPAPHRGGAGR
jgi:hypothetical protein